jgi:uncharacterized protein (DUF2235 family)
MKRIVLSFDGTWNAPGDDGDIGRRGNTNVVKLHQAILERDGGTEQRAWYQPGVGTRWYDRFRGGVLGVGLSRNLQDGYRHLAETFEDGDQVFVLGFSRGAYTARSLCGMIRNVGLVRAGGLGPRRLRDRIHDAESIYRTRDEGADTPQAVAFREAHSREIEIHFLGVWDTVGALGVPLSSFAAFNRRFYDFHDTELSGIVRHAFQAVAIDEHREPYAATLWEPRRKPKQVMEQVWFAGAHANVGGGYAGNPLSEVALAWMAGNARRCGLALDHALLPSEEETAPGAEIVDSFQRFLGGLYARFSTRSHRPLGRLERGNERLHPSVATRIEADDRYRPQNPVWPYLDSDGRQFPEGRLW